MASIDHIEYSKRIFTIQGWIIEGVQSPLIIRKIIELGWTNAKKDQDKRRVAERLLQKARDEWTSIVKADIEQRRELRISYYEQLARSMQERFKGTPAGIAAVMQINKQIDLLAGLKPPQKMEVSGPGGKPIETKNETTVKSNVDYTKLPDEVLEAIVNARITEKADT